MKPTVFIADDHPLILEGTKTFLEVKGYQVKGVATDGLTAFNKIMKQNPDVVLIDYRMPKLNGLELAQRIKQAQNQIKCVILTSHLEEDIALQVGKSIDGYLLKDAALAELEQCLQDVLEGKKYISSTIYEQVFFSHTPLSIQGLTPAEQKILYYLSRSKTNVQIAELLFISRRTVEKHRSNITQKLKLGPHQNALIIWLQQNKHYFEEPR